MVKFDSIHITEFPAYWESISTHVSRVPAKINDQILQFFLCIQYLILDQILPYSPEACWGLSFYVSGGRG